MQWRKTLMAISIAGVLLTQSACGTLLHPERKGQTGGRIDPAIAVLDGIGLLFYLVPGIVAFAVDFSNGTIYLPSESARVDSIEERAPVYTGPLDSLRTVSLEGEIDAQRLDALIERELGIRDVLANPDLEVRRVEEADHLRSPGSES